MNENFPPSFLITAFWTSVWFAVFCKISIENSGCDKGVPEPHWVELEEALKLWVWLPMVTENGPPSGDTTHLIEIPVPEHRTSCDRKAMKDDKHTHEREGERRIYLSRAVHSTNIRTTGNSRKILCTATNPSVWRWRSISSIVGNAWVVARDSIILPWRSARNSQLCWCTSRWVRWWWTGRSRSWERRGCSCNTGSVCGDAQ